MAKKSKKNKKKLITDKQQAKTEYSPSVEQPKKETAKRPRIVTGSASETTFASIASVQKLAGRYKLVGEIARGGMGIVFEGKDEKLDDMPVAIKVLPDELARNEAAIIRLKKEALAAIKLTHKNIVRLHAFEQDGDATFLVMELLGGANLEVELAHREKLPLEEVIAIGDQVAEALAEAHRQNIVHRDIKPANLMYTSKEDDKLLKVTDFGIAFELKESMTRVTSMTAMTPLYASPEQLRAENITAKSDQYSLAITLYELLVGRPPFSGAGLEHQIVNATARPVANVPAHVNAALSKAMSKNPDDRFADCEEFMAAMKGKKVVASSGSMGKWLALMVLLVAAGLGLQHVRKPSPQPTLRPLVTPSMSATAKPTVTNQPTINATPAAAQEMSTVFLSSKPQGASIFLDGKDSGQKTNDILRNVPVGKQTIVLKHPMYYSEKVEVNVEKDKVNKPEEVLLKPAWGQLILNGEPKEIKFRLRPLSTSISIADKEYGLGEKVEKLPTGKYLVEAYAPLFERKTITVEVPGNKETLSQSIKLDRMTASLTINSTPKGASISINGKLRAEKTPATIEGISCIEQEIYLEKDELYWQERVFIKEGGISLNATMKAKPGELLITSNPVGAKIYCKNLPPEQKSFGKTTAEGLRKPLPPGSYTLKAILQHYRIGEKTLEVRGKETTKAHFDLVKKLGSLLIKVAPKPSSLKLNNKPLALSQIGKKISLKPGLHLIEAKLKNHHPARTKVKVTDGQTATAALELKKIGGYLDLTVIPTRASVYLVNDYIPENQRKNIFRHPGLYRTIVSCPGYLQKETYIDIKDGQRISRTIRLEKIVANPGRPFTNSIGMQMIWVPAGSFRDPLFSENNQYRTINITSGYWIGKYEVTQVQWNKLMGSNPSERVGSDIPVHKVTWSEAADFCKKLSLREAATYKLPTTAQWIYAARSGGTQPRLYGNEDEIGWHANNSNLTLQRVGQKKPNAWGMYDVLGNASEWAEDSMDYISGGSLTDPFCKSHPAHRNIKASLGSGVGWIPSSFKDMYVSVQERDERKFCMGLRVIRLPQ